MQLLKQNSLWSASLCLILFWAITLFIGIRYVEIFEIKHSFESWHIAIQYSIISSPFLIAIMLGRRKAAWVFWFACGAFQVLLLTSYIIQEQAALNVSDLVSFYFLWMNWAVVVDLFGTAYITFFFILLVSIALLLAISLRTTTVFIGESRSIVGTLLIAAILWIHAITGHASGTEQLKWEPVLALFGYSDQTDVLNKSADLVRKENKALKKYKSTDAPKKKNIIIFMADSINPYHLSIFGYEKKTLPILDRIKTDYNYFGSAIGRSTCHDSICGVKSLFASRTYSAIPPTKSLSLGEVLKRHGYSIKMILASDHRGYLRDSYGTFIETEASAIHDHTVSDHPLNSDKIVVEGLSLLPPAAETPNLIFVFFFSAHISGDQDPEFHNNSALNNNWFKWLKKRDEELSADELTGIADHYDNKLRQLNYYMQRSYDVLKDKGYTENSHFIFLSDHGEELGQRNHLGHVTLSEGAIRIPVIWASNEPVPMINTNVPTQVDIAPTLLDKLEIPTPTIWEGSSLYSNLGRTLIFHENGRWPIRTGRDCKAVYGELLDYKEAKFVWCSLRNGSEEFSFHDLKRDLYEQENIWENLSASKKASLKEQVKQRFNLN